MEQIYNKLSDGILILDKDGGIKFGNEKILMALGYKSGDIEGRSIYDICCNSKDINNLVEYGDKECLMMEFLSKNSTSIMFKVNIYLGLWRNREAITVILKEEELYTKRDLESFIENAPFMCAIKEPDGKYVYVNKATRKVLKLRKEDIIGKNNRDVFGDNGQELALIEDREVIEKGTIVPYNKYVQKEDGYVQWLDGYKMPVFGEDGQIKYIAKVAKDITLRKKIEQEFIEKYDDFYNVNEILYDDYYEIENYGKLEILQESFLNQLGALGLNVWIYNNKTESLVSEFRSGVCEEFSLSEEISIKIDRETFISKMINLKYEWPLPIEQRVENINKNKAQELGIKYHGIYKITFNNEILGLISVFYEDYNESTHYNSEEFKKICEQIGMLAKNQNLYNKLKKEFSKRREIENELEEFLNTAMDMMAVIDINGNITKINKEASKIFGWEKSELLNMKWQDMIHPDDLDITKDIVEKSKLQHNVVNKIVNRYKNKSGEIVWLDWGFKYIEDKKVLICTAKDITENKRLEEARAEYEKALHLESVKNEFFSNISHEFKTPLNIILATMQLVNRSIERKEVQVIGNLDIKKYMKSIVQNSYRLLRLVNNLIDITRIDTGFYKLNLENKNIVSVIEDITVSVAQYVENKGISLIFDTDVEEEVIACDPDKVERIMLNLLSNAIKYTDCNGEINVNITTSIDEIIVSVEDDGIGIPKEKLITIFDRFIQVDNTLTRKCEGSGIGLSLVKSLVELHGGSIMAQSEEGHGTEFIFKLPIRTIDSEIKISENTLNSKVEKCSIEFSDIYNL